MFVVGRIGARTEQFQSSFNPNCIFEWNKLDPEIRLAQSVAVFKAKLLSIIRLPTKSVFGTYDPIGLLTGADPDRLTVLTEDGQIPKPDFS